MCVVYSTTVEGLLQIAISTNNKDIVDVILKQPGIDVNRADVSIAIGFTTGRNMTREHTSNCYYSDGATMMEFC